MYGFIYLWENTHPEAKIHKKYIGQHAGTPDDGYIGSGVIFLKRFYCKKYRGFWKRSVLATCNSRKELDMTEDEWINKTDAVNSKEYCNYRYGGHCGKLSKETKAKISKANKGRPAWNGGIKSGPQTPELISKRVKSIQAVAEKRFQEEQELLLERINKAGYLKREDIIPIIGRGTQIVETKHINRLMQQKKVKRVYFGTNDIRFTKLDFSFERDIIEFIKTNDGCTVQEIWKPLKEKWGIGLDIVKYLCCKMKKQKSIFQYRGYRKNPYTLIPN